MKISQKKKKENISLLIRLPVYSLIYLYLYALMPSYFTVTVTVLMFKLSPIWALRSSFKLVLCPATFSTFFKHFLMFWQNNLGWA